MKYYTDGYTIKGNPSKIGGGFTITDEYGEVIKTSRIEKSGFTCNEAELLGVRYVCEIAERFDDVSTDSQIILAWIRKRKSKARPDLNTIICEICDLIDEKGVDIYWEGRENNLAGHYNEDTFSA